MDIDAALRHCRSTSTRPIVRMHTGVGVLDSHTVVALATLNTLIALRVVEYTGEGVQALVYAIAFGKRACIAHRPGEAVVDCVHAHAPHNCNAYAIHCSITSTR